jgi:hypothetical protein
LRRIASAAVGGRKYPNYFPEGTILSIQDRQLDQEPFLLNGQEMPAYYRESKRGSAQLDRHEDRKTLGSFKNSLKPRIDGSDNGNRERQV